MDEDKLKVLLEKIALENLDIETLEVRNSDRLDFHEVSVGALKAALRRAFIAGQDSIKYP